MKGRRCTLPRVVRYFPAINHAKAIKFTIILFIISLGRMEDVQVFKSFEVKKIIKFLRDEAGKARRHKSEASC